MTARRVAYDALRRIEGDGAYANLVLRTMLDRSGLTDQDRRFATDLVYGTTRMRRACDALVDRFVTSPPDDATRTLLRLGAYQLVFGDVAPHAAVSETVGLAPRRTRGFVNAVLRKVSATDMVRCSPDRTSLPLRATVPDAAPRAQAGMAVSRPVAATAPVLDDKNDRRLSADMKAVSLTV